MRTHLPNMASRAFLHSLYLFIEFAQLHYPVKHYAEQVLQRLLLCHIYKDSRLTRVRRALAR
jgi:hypothetical protein